MGSRLAAGVLSLGVLTSSAHSRAQPSEPSNVLGFTFQANASCATADELTARIEGRVPRLKLERREEAAVQITLSEEGPKVRAELVILLSNKEELTRSIEANDCKSALETISFIAAVALDPGAQRPLAIRKIAEDKLPPPEQPKESATDSADASARKVRAQLEWKLGAMGSATWGPAPSALLGGELYVSLSHQQGGIWSPGFRFSTGYARRSGFEESAGSARFELFDVSLDLCPSQWGGISARLQFCGAANLGALRATGSETFRADQVVRPWAALGGALNLGFSPVQPLWLESRFGALVPLFRDEFLFDDSVFHRVWPVSLDISLGLAVRFW